MRVRECMFMVIVLVFLPPFYCYDYYVGALLRTLYCINCLAEGMYAGKLCRILLQLLSLCKL